MKKLADEDLSLSEMASELDVTVGRVRLNLDKYNITTSKQEEYKIMKKYFSATTEESRSKAFVEVDKYLQQIAKEEAEFRKDSTYEDCLQDVRLRFLELAKEKEKKGVDFLFSISSRLRNSKALNQEEIKTVSLEKLSKTKLCDVDSNMLVERFEDNDFGQNFRKYLQKQVSCKNYSVFMDYVDNGLRISELAKRYECTEGRIRQILNEVLSIARTSYEEASKKGL